MKQERPIRAEESAALADQLRRAFASDGPRATVYFADREFQLQRVSQGEFIMENAEAPTPTRVLHESESAPVDYPTDLPFLPGEIVMLSGTEWHVMAVWWSRTDPDHLLNQLDTQLRTSGWTRDPDAPIPVPGATRRTYRKGGRLQYVMAGQGIVSVTRRPAPTV